MRKTRAKLSGYQRLRNFLSRIAMESDSTLSAVCDHLAEFGVLTTPTDIQRHAPPKIAPQISDEDLLQATNRVSVRYRKGKSRRESRKSRKTISISLNTDSFSELDKLKKRTKAKTYSEVLDSLLMEEGSAHKIEKEKLKKQKEKYEDLRLATRKAFKEITIELEGVLRERAISATSKFQYKSKEEQLEMVELLFKKERKEILNKATTARLMRIIRV